MVPSLSVAHLVNCPIHCFKDLAMNRHEKKYIRLMVFSQLLYDFKLRRCLLCLRYSVHGLEIYFC